MEFYDIAKKRDYEVKMGNQMLKSKNKPHYYLTIPAGEVRII